MQAESRQRFAIIGARMSGILAAVKLREGGHDFTVFEKAERVGGTWRENTYPGIACDVPSHLYAYSFELNPDWHYANSPGSEIQEYFEGVAHRHGVEDRVRFNDPVTRCEWQGDCWEVESASGFVGHFEWVIAATGALHSSFPVASRNTPSCTPNRGCTSTTCNNASTLTCGICNVRVDAQNRRAA
jgi:cation diffusion facilitator CzcD-associated flavoprotein CzcO